jgi:sulfide:quinone oxidoreductase
MTPTRNVVIAGGGVAALEAALALHELAQGRVAVSVIAPDDELTYRPISVAAPFVPDALRRYSISDILDEHGATLVCARLRAVDADRCLALLDDGRELAYDDLVIALGAERVPAFDGALTFVDQRSVPGFRELLDAVERGDVRRLAFVAPEGVVWPLPLYELALMTAAFARDRGLRPEIALATPASAPLALFGERAERAMAEMLAEAGIVFHGEREVRVAGPHRVLLEPGGPALDVDRIVALPRLRGTRLRGVSHDRDGFIPVDDYGRVRGLEGVYAVGDCVDFPLKQGGLAAQQADVVAAVIAADAGAPVEPEPFRPLLRGVLLTGRNPRWLRAALETWRVEGSEVSENALWWPPAKVAARYLGPRLGLHDDAAVADGTAGVPVEVRLEARPADHPAVSRRAILARARDEGESRLIELH